MATSPKKLHADEFFDEADTETVDTIKDLLETRIRPARRRATAATSPSAASRTALSILT